MVRTFVATADPTYKAFYQEILDIRDGKSPRPLEYWDVYWDLVQKDQPRPRAFGAAVALLDSMRQAGFTEAEFAQLAQAKKSSDELTQIEIAAMALVEADPAQSPGSAERAIRMLHDDAYRQAKAAIMQPIGEFSRLANQRTMEEVQQAKAHALRMRNLLIAILLVQLLLLWMTRRQLYAILGSSVEGLHRHIVRLGSGDFTSDIQVPAGAQGSVLGWLSEIRARLASLDLHHFKAIVHSTDDAVISRTLAGVVSGWNPGAERIFGYAAAQMVGQTMHALVPPEREDEDARLLASAAAGQRFEHFETVRRSKDGRLVEISATISPILDDAGRVLGVSMIARDISRRKQAELDLQESEIRYRTAFMTSPDAINITRVEDGRYLEVSAGFERMTGWRRDEVVGRTSVELGLWADGGDRQRFMQALERDGRYENLEARFKAKDGHIVVGLMSAHLMVVKGERCLLSVTRDITERKHAEEKLKLAASVFSYAREGITITDAQGTVVDVNDTFTDITGYARGEAIGKNLRILASGRHDKAFFASLWAQLTEKGHWYGEIWNRRKNGDVYAEALTISAVKNSAGVTQNYVGLFSDVTLQKEHEQHLEHIAHYDALTNLPNRVLLADRMKQAMTQALRHKDRVAVAYLDLDGFKDINDRYGHQVGDQLLIAIANNMKQALREGDTLARLGGDEFVAVLLDLHEAADSFAMLNRILAAAATPVQIGDHLLQVSASAGVTFFPQEQNLDADQLLRQADQAMYQAKLAGKNRCQVFDAAHDSNLRVHHESLEHIRIALERQEFVLHYQPKVNMRTGELVGVEALIRWQHPQRGLLAPGAFLPVIESHPLSVELGEWVMDQALTQVERWRAAGMDLQVSVNVGALQLQQPDFVERLQAVLARHPALSPNRLELEILETSALEDVAQVSELIDTCARLGVRFALDDFGTGYSSLTYLKRLHVGLLKIDQSFVRDMLDDPDDLAILEGIIGLAAAFGRQVIAEGVETAAHGRALLHLGCDLAQGYGIARPMPAADIAQWAGSWQPDPSWSELPWLGGGE
ncbi:GGDEF domain-containing protein [Rhodoferax lacus]|uniref:GGDEF domain-containing protein n=2 Tax=Rhodoferax lacus TaxID=2184758 RepID=A0A3E1R5U4_9BURK|nr:GGDEF domain-containing protein [Rhodoferax lacus]